MSWRKLLTPRIVGPDAERVTRAPATAIGLAAAAPTQHPPANKRRAYRVSAFMPVFVYGHTNNQPFAEHTVTLNVSATGGFLALSAEVSPSEKLLMANVQTDEELLCRIARVIKTQGGKTLVGFEFLRSSPRFWSIEFA